MTEPTLSLLEAPYLSQQVVKNAKHIQGGPRYLREYLHAVRRQIKIEKKLADDLRLPRHKRGFRHNREMLFIEMLQQLTERIGMSFEDNDIAVTKYLTDSNWMRALYIQYLTLTECKLARNKAKLLLRVDKLTALYLDELLDRHENLMSDEGANGIAWQIQTATRNLIGKGVPPEPSMMRVGDTDSLFSMLNKLQLVEIFYAKGLNSNYVKSSSLRSAMESILKPLQALHRGRKTSSEIFTLFKAALKALRSLYSCYGGDHVLPREDRIVFCSAELGTELLFWLKVTLDVRNGVEFLAARREHRHSNMEDAVDDSSSVATGWKGSGGANNNDSFARVVVLIGNGLVHDLLWCVNVFVIACTNDQVDIQQMEEKLAKENEHRDRDRQGLPSPGKSSKRPQNSSKEGISNTSQKAVPENKPVSQLEKSGKNNGQMVMGATSHSPSHAVLSDLISCALGLSRIIICRYAFMQHATDHGNPALSNVAMLRAADEEAVVALDVASTVFSLGMIYKLGTDILEAGISLSYSRSQNVSIPIAALQCFYKAALCIIQGGTAEDEPTGINRNPNNLTKMIYEIPNRTTSRGRLVHSLGHSSLKIMHVMNVHSASLSVTHTGLGIIRLIAREQFMKRADVDQLVGLAEDDYSPEPDDPDHADLGSVTTRNTPSVQSNSVSVPSTARRGTSPTRSHSPQGHGHALNMLEETSSVVSDMNSTISNVSLTSTNALDEPLPDMDDPDVPVASIFSDWMHKTAMQIFPPELHAHGHGKVEAVEGKHAHMVGIATLLKFIGETHTQCIEVVEQLLLLVYHLGKSSYSIKIALLEAGFEKIIQQLSVTTSHNYYVSALCSLAHESLQMDQIVL
jgi:hypothetical protein